MSVIHSQLDIDPKFLNIPYKFAGRDFNGADCVGLAILWYKELGIHYQYGDREGPIHMNWYKNHPRRLVEAITQYGTLIRFSDLKKHDMILVTNTGDDSIPVCIGIMADDRHILTTNDKQNSFAEMLDMKWKERFWGGIHLFKVQEREI